MDIAIIVTYRCNSKCSMCNVWKNPSLPDEEITLKILEKIPDNIGAINLTGGEPTLRSDLAEIVDLLYNKTDKLEISSNGLLPEKLIPIVRKHPDTRIRFSLEGNEKTNNLIRGEKNGWITKVDGLAKLKKLGGTDLGFAVVIQDDNVTDLVDLFRFAKANGYELSTSTLHNGFQFHKNDNVPYDPQRIARYIGQLVNEQLKTNDIKTWFRAYLNMGLIARVIGEKRLLPCMAGSECLFIDPWGDVYACNVRPDLYMGNLVEHSWSEIISGEKTLQVLEKVKTCPQNCWMVGTAKTAMRNPRFKRLPKFEPFIWVVKNKLRQAFGKEFLLQTRINNFASSKNAIAPVRPSYLNENVVKKVQTKDEQHYSQPGGYVNN